MRGRKAPNQSPATYSTWPAASSVTYRTWTLTRAETLSSATPLEPGRPRVSTSVQHSNMLAGCKFSHSQNLDADACRDTQFSHPIRTWTPPRVDFRVHEPLSSVTYSTWTPTRGSMNSQALPGCTKAWRSRIIHLCLSTCPPSGHSKHHQRMQFISSP